MTSRREVAGTSLTAGTVVDIRATDLGLSGEGIGRAQGQVVFVPGLLPGETGRVRLARSRRGSWQAQLLERTVTSADRRRPPCILAERCGGCTLQHLGDAAQARWKERHLRETLRRIAGLDAAVLPILPASEPLGYRNKALIPLERTPAGTLRAGYYRRGSHRIVNMNRCPVLDPRLDRLIAPIKADLEASGVPADVDLRHGGGLRHLGLRLGSRSGEVLLVLISSHGDLEGLEHLAARWCRRWPELAGVVLNLQPERSNTVMGPRNHTLAGRDALEEVFAGVTLRIGADTFFQVNTAQAEAVVDLLARGLALGEGDRLIDAYCGIGTFSLPLAARGARVWGLERQPSSIEQARGNAARNGLEGRARFELGDVTVRLPELLTAATATETALLLDPPRRGLDAALCRTIAAHPPGRLAYLSCNPATLARDLQHLCAEGTLQVESVRPIDFFPQTSHVEALALLRSAARP
jgi:23S rRNA (uracil1939-C5)-methyltransferase